jgi:uncharacterized protein YutE (UPF0331/DUF86 family)
MFAKGAIIERCLRRVLEIYRDDPTLTDLLHLDALTLNVERACQAAIDLALHIVAIRHLGMPESQADAFRLLEEAGEIDRELSERMIAMCGFRNVIVHQYQEVDLDILHAVASGHWNDFVALCHALGLRIVVDPTA